MGAAQGGSCKGDGREAGGAGGMPPAGVRAGCGAPGAEASAWLRTGRFSFTKELCTATGCCQTVTRCTNANRHAGQGECNTRNTHQQSSEFRVYSSLPTANRLSWPYKPCLASSGPTPPWNTTCTRSDYKRPTHTPVPAAATLPYGRAWHHARRGSPAASA